MHGINDLPLDVDTKCAGIVENEDARAQLMDQAWRNILLGRTDPYDFVELVQEDQFDAWEWQEEKALAIFSIVLEARRQQLSQLPLDARTTSLTRAFAELETQGILARQNFSCCGTCAPGDIEREPRPGDGKRGYVYFHEQDAEALIEERSTYLGYGCFRDTIFPDDVWDAMTPLERNKVYAEHTVELMKSVVLPVLLKHNIEVDWSGDIATRISIANVDYVADVHEGSGNGESGDGEYDDGESGDGEYDDERVPPTPTSSPRSAKPWWKFW